jgi:hypothetical protein
MIEIPKKILQMQIANSTDPDEVDHMLYVLTEDSELIELSHNADQKFKSAEQ